MPEPSTDPSLIVRGTTVALNVRFVLMTGEPLSVTITVIAFVLATAFVAGYHVKIPVEELMLAPTGAPPPKLNVKACAGKSASLAALVTINVRPASAN